MLLAASSPGRSPSVHRARHFVQPCRAADACGAGTRARERRSDPARTSAEILVADLNRPRAAAMAAGMRLDFDRMAYHVFTLLVGARLTASEGAARRAIAGDTADRVGGACCGWPRARRRG